MRAFGPLVAAAVIFATAAPAIPAPTTYTAPYPIASAYHSVQRCVGVGRCASDGGATADRRTGRLQGFLSADRDAVGALTSWIWGFADSRIRIPVQVPAGTDRLRIAARVRVSEAGAAITQDPVSSWIVGGGSYRIVVRAWPGDGGIYSGDSEATVMSSETSGPTLRIQDRVYVIGADWDAGDGDTYVGLTDIHVALSIDVSSPPFQAGGVNASADAVVESVTIEFLSDAP